jgi:hypothetical protein
LRSALVISHQLNEVIDSDLLELLTD